MRTPAPRIGPRRKIALWILLAAAGVVLFWSWRNLRAPVTVRATAAHLKVTDLGLPEVSGLSGLTFDDRGALWAVPENDRVLVRLDGGRARAAIKLSGIPSDLQSEALAWVGRGRFVLGTESPHHAVPVDHVLLFEAGSEGAHPIRDIRLDTRGLGIQPVKNQGIEGLCFADGELVATLETPKVVRGHRLAAVLQRPLEAPDSAAWRVHWLVLSSATGTLSALDCKRSADHLSVYAIERHFAVMRLLHFDLPTDGSDHGPIRPTLLEDLAHSITGTPNLEGLALRGRVAFMIVDDDYGHRTGPNLLVRDRMPR